MYTKNDNTILKKR